ncbi:MAG: 30S ribosomal protein S16 [Candidatus Sericytochromatia bacterium]|nr:30S ribosomal protein S16 [Candidatus Sericytochromatia bacterium]
MVRIRLKRIGSIKRPFYRIVVIDQHVRRDGRPLEEIGYYNPRTDPKELKINTESAVKWLKVGAQPTDTVEALFKKGGVYDLLKA